MYLINLFKDAKLFGSILNVNKCNFDEIKKIIFNLINNLDLFSLNYKEELTLLYNILNQSQILYSKYDAIITNPPYMGIKNMNKKLSSFLKDNYNSTKFDLSTVFMERSILFSKNYSFISMINIPGWMFLYTYEELRECLLNSITFINMLHLGRGFLELILVLLLLFLIQNVLMILKELLDNYLKIKDL